MERFLPGLFGLGSIFACNDLIDTLMALLHWNSEPKFPARSDVMTYDCYVLLRHLRFQCLRLCLSTKQGVLRDYLSNYKLPVYSMNNTNSSTSISRLIKGGHVTLFESNK